MRRLILPCLLASTLLSSILGFPSITHAQGSLEDDTLSDCVDASRSISVLFLVDTSLSLQRNDPENGRVDAILSALSVLSTLHSTTDVEVYVDFIEFSSTVRRSFPSSSEWRTVPVDENNQRRIANTYADRNEGGATDYVAALEPWVHAAQKPANEIGALELLGRAPEGSCRMLVWLTDGQLDVRYHGVDRVVNWTDPPTLVDSGSVGEDLGVQAVDRLCSSGGLADRLRSGTGIDSSSGAQLAVVALDPTATLDFGLLQSFATGEDCGSLAPRGTFVSAADISSLILEVYGRVLGQGVDSSGTRSCLDEPGASGACNNVDLPETIVPEHDFPFDLSTGIYGFNLLSLTSHRAVKTSLVTPSGDIYDLSGSFDLSLENGAELSIRQLGIAQGGLLIEADLAPGGSWSGRWRVRYSTSDPAIAAELNRASIYVFGGLMIELDHRRTDLGVGRDGEIALRTVGIAGDVPTRGLLDLETELDLRIGSTAISVPLQDPNGTYSVPYRVPEDYEEGSVDVAATFRASIRVSPNAPPIRLQSWEGDLGRVEIAPVTGLPTVDPPEPFDTALNDTTRQTSTTMLMSAVQPGSGGCIELISIASPEAGNQIASIEVSFDGSVLLPGGSCPVRLEDGESGILTLTVDAEHLDLGPITDDEPATEALTGAITLRSISALDPGLFREFSYVLNVAIERLVSPATTTTEAPTVTTVPPQDSSESEIEEPVINVSDPVVVWVLLAVAVLVMLALLYGQNLYAARLNRRQVGFAEFRIRASEGAIKQLPGNELVSEDEFDLAIASRRAVTLRNVTVTARCSWDPFADVHLEASSGPDRVVVANDGTRKSGRLGRSYAELDRMWVFRTERSDIEIGTDGVEQPIDGVLTLVLPEDEWSGLQATIRDMLRRDNARMARVIFDSIGDLDLHGDGPTADEMAADVAAIEEQVSEVKQRVDDSEHWSAGSDAESFDEDEIEWK